MNQTTGIAVFETIFPGTDYVFSDNGVLEMLDIQQKSSSDINTQVQCLYQSLNG